jgi:hypothetical protein
MITLFITKFYKFIYNDGRLRGIQQLIEHIVVINSFNEENINYTHMQAVSVSKRGGMNSTQGGV